MQKAVLGVCAGFAEGSQGVGDRKFTFLHHLFPRGSSSKGRFWVDVSIRPEF